MTGERQTFPLLGLRRGIGVFGRERTSTHRGDGYEMASSRPYQPSDNMRAIDWAASARLSSARNSDEFIVRENFAEESPRVVLFVDRRPAMRLYPPELPWLHKPAAVAVAGRMIVDSVLAAQGLAGYLDLAEPHAPRWLPPRRRLDAPRIREHELLRTAWTAPEDNLALGFRHFVQARHDLPRGTFVFVLSDFLEPPPAALLRMAAELSWDVVPVIVQTRAGSSRSRISAGSCSPSPRRPERPGRYGSRAARPRSAGVQTRIAHVRSSTASGRSASTRSCSRAMSRSTSLLLSSTGTSAATCV